MSTTGYRAFDTTVEKTNLVLKSIEEGYGWPKERRQQSYDALRAVLHALRDRMPVSEAADLGAQLSVVQGVEFDAVERAYCELSWSTDIADRSHAREFARQLFVYGLHINFQVNRVLWKDGRHFIERPIMVEQVAALQIPTLIIHGALDPRPARVARHLAQCMPSARYVELPNVGHLLWIERPDLLKDALRSFLEQLS